MTITDFNQLELNKRCDLIWEWGFFLSRAKHGEVSRVLYSLNDYLVEVRYNLIDNKIIDAQAFAKSKLQKGEFEINFQNPFLRMALSESSI
jgi:hypothetical protein